MLFVYIIFAYILFAYILFYCLLTDLFLISLLVLILITLSRWVIGRVEKVEEIKKLDIYLVAMRILLPVFVF